MNKKMLSKIMALASAAVICCGAFASCGDNKDDNKNGGQTSAAQTDAPASSSASEIADKLHSDITYVDQLNELSADMIEKLYGISADKYTDAKVYVGGVSTAEEIACFDAADETAAAEIKKACEDRIAAQIKAVEGYNPNELDKLNDPVLVTKGNSVYMCLSNDNDSASKIIG